MRHWQRHLGGMSKKTLPPMELQIPANATTLVASYDLQTGNGMGLDWI